MSDNYDQRLFRQLRRIADALERMSPPPEAAPEDENDKKEPKPRRGVVY